MIYLKAIGIGLLIFGTPSLLLVGGYILVEHIMRVRDDRKELRALREYRHAMRERDRHALKTLGI